MAQIMTYHTDSPLVHLESASTCSWEAVTFLSLLFPLPDPLLSSQGPSSLWQVPPSHAGCEVFIPGSILEGDQNSGFLEL